MLCDPTRRRVHVHDQLEQMADDKYRMISQCEEIQNVNLIARINLNGAQEV